MSLEKSVTIAIKALYALMAGVVLFPEKNLLELAIFSVFLLLTIVPYRKKELDNIPKNIRSKFLIGITSLQIFILGIFTAINIWNNPSNTYMLAAYSAAAALLIANLKLTNSTEK